MSNARPPAQPPYGQAPPKPRRKLRNALLIAIALCVLFIAGCTALVGLAAKDIGESVDKSMESMEDDELPGGPENPMTIVPGKAFEVRGFNYAAGWSVGPDTEGAINVTKLRLTNNREERDGAFVEIKLWRGTEVVAATDCTTDRIDPGATVTVSCLSADDMPQKYNKVTINDGF